MSSKFLEAESVTETDRNRNENYREVVDEDSLAEKIQWEARYIEDTLNL
jgi:hypothetical protein